ncbi:hypothetical protein [Risungbinella massiliensis]|uniref:hypothetical protein n=1 Tax=Risungbinella massiliensis TaxID=1329796 RepID=UPI0005CC33E9|nr:hypothetical protein [Risungbinella massiliensis]
MKKGFLFLLVLLIGSVIGNYFLWSDIKTLQEENNRISKEYQSYKDQTNSKLKNLETTLDDLNNEPRLVEFGQDFIEDYLGNLPKAERIKRLTANATPEVQKQILGVETDSTETDSVVYNPNYKPEITFTNSNLTWINNEKINLVIDNTLKAGTGSIKMNHSYQHRLEITKVSGKWFVSKFEGKTLH